MKKRAVKHKSIKKKLYLSEYKIRRNVEDINSKEDKIGYLKTILSNPKLLKIKTFRWANEQLGRLYVELEDISNAAKAFKNAKDKIMARRCNSASRTFTKSDEKKIVELENRLKSVYNSKL